MRPLRSNQAARVAKRRAIVGAADLNAVYWILIVVCLGVLGWVGWEYAHSPAAPQRAGVGLSNSASRELPVSQVVQPMEPQPAASQPPVWSNPPPARIENANYAATLPPTPPTNSGVVAPVPAKETAPTNVSKVAAFPVGQYAPPVLEVQIALSRRGISCGSLDGVMGAQTRAALRAFQRGENLSITGELDAATRARLIVQEPILADYVVTAADLARLCPLASTWVGKSEQARLDYESVLELVSEKGHAHPALIRRLNPGVDWTNVLAGLVAKIPAVDYPGSPGKAAYVRIALSERILEAFNAASNLVAHFPCSIARHVEKRPVGQLRVVVIAPNPNYTFNPEIFPESAEARQLGRKLTIPSGPNNPVGVAWIGLDKPGYGIHGTPSPEQVGRTESHGCFRLANWNAEYLLKLVAPGTPVFVDP